MNTIPGPARHNCLDSLGGTGWAYEKLGVGGLSQCGQCDRWYVLRIVDGLYDRYSWRPVRWYHFRSKARIVDSYLGAPL